VLGGGWLIQNHSGILDSRQESALDIDYVDYEWYQETLKQTK
jgi:hypothetical protein